MSVAQPRAAELRRPGAQSGSLGTHGSGHHRWRTTTHRRQAGGASQPPAQGPPPRGPAWPCRRHQRGGEATTRPAPTAAAGGRGRTGADGVVDGQPGQHRRLGGHRGGGFEGAAVDYRGEVAGCHSHCCSAPPHPTSQLEHGAAHPCCFQESAHALVVVVFIWHTTAPSGGARARSSQASVWLEGHAAAGSAPPGSCHRLSRVFWL